MDQAQVMKREREDWTRLYHKTLKGIEAMIDVQRMTKDIKKLVEEMNTILTEIEGMCHKLHSAYISTTSGPIFTN